jgi:hypothetical protein
MSALYQTIETEWNAYLAELVASQSDGFQFSDVPSLLASGAIRGTRIMQATGASGPEKKEAVLMCLETMYDRIILPIDLPFIPNYIIEPMVDKALKAAIRPGFGPLIDRVVGEQKAAGTF